MDLITPPIYSEHWEGTLVGRDPLHTYAWLWFGYNIRVIAVHGREGIKGNGYDYAWCFPRDPRLVMEHLRAWDSWTQDEPSGWHKRPSAVVRRAPFRDPTDPRNRPRCEHGSYLDTGCRTEVCMTTIDYQEKKVLKQVGT
jgi:hypothetical protein